MKKHLAIAIDGPSGAGKSTAAKIVAKKMDILYVDTGALYRTVAYYLKTQGVEASETEKIESLLPTIHIEVSYENGKQVNYVNGENPGDKIREPDISMRASAVSAIPAVRAFLLETQKEIARNNSVVMDGRDIGTVILPQADLKVFLIASDDARAQRRFDELQGKGIHTTLEEVLQDMQTRDSNDRNRKTAPAVQAEDAILLDNSNMTAEETAETIIELLYRPTCYRKRRKFGFWYSIMHFLLGGPIRLIRGIHIHGKENEPFANEGPYILCCNHLTWRDPILLCASTKWQHPHFMAKKELFAIPGFAWMIKSLGAYPVTRGANDVSAIKHTINLIKDGTSVGMFPQGHRYKGVNPKETPHKNGAALVAARTHAPILPIAFTCKNYSPKIFHRLDVVIGKPITWKELSSHAQNEHDYDGMATYIFDRICELAQSKEK